MRTNRGWAFQRAQSTASLEIAKQLLQKKKEAADAAANENDPGRTDSSGSASGEDRTAKLKALLEASTAVNTKMAQFHDVADLRKPENLVALGSKSNMFHAFLKKQHLSI